VFKAYLKIKHPFWSQQPVFHYYNLIYWIKPPGVIDKNKPQLSRYVDLLSVKFDTIDNAPSSTIDRFIGFIRSNYLRSTDCNYIPKKEHILPYFSGHRFKCFLSIYQSLQNGNILGAMTTRPVYLTHKNRLRSVYYVDYLCVKRSERKKDVAPAVIQTHHYHQRRQESEIHVSMFKREGSLTNIVPLCVYNTRTFKINDLLSDWQTPNLSDYRVSLISKNINVLDVVLSREKKRFDYFIESDLININHLMETNNIYVFCLHVMNEPVALLFFRDLKCTYRAGNSFSLFASIGSKDYEAIAWAAIESLKILTNKSKSLQYICIEEIGDICDWIELAVGKVGVRDILPPSPTAYYMYNYADYTVDSKKVTIIL
jgi:hypothetical protein